MLFLFAMFSVLVPSNHAKAAAVEKFGHIELTIRNVAEYVFETKEHLIVPVSSLRVQYDDLYDYVYARGVSANGDEVGVYFLIQDDVIHEPYGRCESSTVFFSIKNNQTLGFDLAVDDWHMVSTYIASMEVDEMRTSDGFEHAISFAIHAEYKLHDRNDVEGALSLYNHRFAQYGDDDVFSYREGDFFEITGSFTLFLHGDN